METFKKAKNAARKEIMAMGGMYDIARVQGAAMEVYKSCEPKMCVSKPQLVDDLAWQACLAAM